MNPLCVIKVKKILKWEFGKLLSHPSPTLTGWVSLFKQFPFAAPQFLYCLGWIR